MPTLPFEIPLWMKTIYFNYCFKEYESIESSAEMIRQEWRYLAFNKRHRPVMQLIVRSANGSGSAEETTGLLTFNPWGWDENQSIKENRLGLERPGAYAYADDNYGSLAIEFANSGLSMQTTKLREEYYFYDSRGKRNTDYIVQRAGGGSFTLSLLRQILDSCVVSDSSPTYGAQVRQFSLDFTLFAAEITNLEVKSYRSLSPNVHEITTRRAAAGESIGSYEPTVDDIVRVNSPIPKLQRLQTLDTGQWAEISLEEGGPACAARFYGLPYNNVYMNLANQGDTGILQMLNAADADFVYRWTTMSNINFNDIRAIQSALMSYLGVLAAYTCRSLGIRYQYIEYIKAVIAYSERMRGVTQQPNFGSHNFYPWFSAIQGGYTDFLDDVFELFSIELSANDTPAVLRAAYTNGITNYQAWMAGGTSGVTHNIAKLGQQVAQNINKRLLQVQQFKERYMWAEIDRALADAYLSDVAFSGNITINDPAVIIRPGDSVRVDFLDSSQDLKVVGVDMSVSVEDLTYSAQVKKQW